MGNEQSSQAGSSGSSLQPASESSAVAHPRVSKHRSLSPEKSTTTPVRAARMNRYRASFRQGNLSDRAVPLGQGRQGSGSGASLTVNGNANGENGSAGRLPRRTKSFRPGVLRAPNSFRVPVCQTTGLTANQKLLITSKWKEMDRPTALELGRNVFETVFRREPRFLKVIEFDDGTNRDWRAHPNFRVHVNRFIDMLNDVIRYLDEPTRSLNSIREFGAAYAAAPSPSGESSAPRPHVPSAFWDAVIFALNNAAKDMQVETSSRSSESPTSLDRRFLLPSAPEDPPTFTLASSSAPHMRRLGYVTGSVCPRVAEAWNLLATFIVGQMRFAYELERLLQAEIKKLGLGSTCVELEQLELERNRTPPSQQSNVQFTLA
uniref:GLOBIN domain-containing protein n=1 Tax=Panagrellus redivivus TaxID=6233 RepID=A0A7E4V7M8_PANRE